MELRADLHVHTDYNPETRFWHGDKPKNIARGIVDSKLDIYAITEHNHRGNKVGPRFFQVQERVAELLQGTAREALGLLGVELSGVFEGKKYHVGYIFEGDYSAQTLPYIPDTGFNFRELEDYRAAYPGIAILNHPTIREYKGRKTPDQIRQGLGITSEFLRSGLVNGVEILNGSILNNDLPDDITKSVIDLFRAAVGDGHRLAAIGASDAHVGADNRAEDNMVGQVVTEFTGENKRDIFRCIREQRTRAKPQRPDIRRSVSSILRGYKHRKQWDSYIAI
ncbi:MAG: hypothetical protein AAB373_04155 [Patescibacteria group bacterium]